MLVPLQYKLLAICIVMLSIFTYGYHTGSSNEKKNTEKVKIEYEAEIQKYQDAMTKLQNDLTIAQSQVREVVVTKYITKTAHVQEKNNGIQELVKLMPSKSYMSNGWVYLHDKAADSNSGDAITSSAVDGSPSTIRDNIALGTITSTYAICHQTEEQLKSLQEWVRTTKEVIDNSNSNKKMSLGEK